MPGLMVIHDEVAAAQPLKDTLINGSIHMTIQTALLIQSLETLGSMVSWTSCNIYSIQDHAAAAIATAGMPVFAFKGELLYDYWEFMRRIFALPGEEQANMILNDGGDATLLHLGTCAEKDASILNNLSSEEKYAYSRPSRKS